MNVCMYVCNVCMYLKKGIGIDCRNKSKETR